MSWRANANIDQSVQFISCAANGSVAKGIFPSERPSNTALRGAMYMALLSTMPSAGATVVASSWKD